MTRQLVREWTSEGAVQRERCYQMLVDEVCSRIAPKDTMNLSEQTSVLNPGAGLGRLAYEFAKRGFRCEGNELSHHMLAVQQMVLNDTESKDEFEVCPFIHSYSNVKTEAQPLRKLTVPDEHPRTLAAAMRGV